MLQPNASFDEVLAEPDSLHSTDFVWQLSYTCFTMWLKLGYVIFTTLWSCYIAAAWGVYFSMVTFEYIWLATPLIKAIEIAMTLFAKFYRRCVFSTVGLLVEPMKRYFELLRSNSTTIKTSVQDLVNFFCKSEDVDNIKTFIPNTGRGLHKLEDALMGNTDELEEAFIMGRPDKSD